MPDKLTELAAACYNGACNPLGIINAMPEAIKGLSQDEARSSVKLKMIIGQLSFLLGESLGPTFEALDAYKKEAANEKA